MKHLRRDPVAAVLAADDAALRYVARRDLLGETAPGASVDEFPGVRQAVARQQPDGRWKYPGGNLQIRSRADYDQLETYRQLAVLVCKFGLDHRHAAVARAAEFLSSFQTVAGDYRGIYGRQYTPNYSAAITELLLRAGYEGSAQVENTMRWLLAMRQDDGGWAIPTRTLGLPLNVMLTARETFEPDRSRPSSHLVTGIVLRALAAHRGYRHSADTRRAGELLKSRFFLRDAYPDRAAPSYWLVFSYPFWWTDLLSALDSLAEAGFRADDPDIARGVAWFVDNQEPNGLWNTGRNRPKDPHSDFWVGLAICRMLNAVGGPSPNPRQ
ncbi:MAG: hypothetical protein ACM3ML_05065 [Micromonosporaceae bacterium]